MIEVVINLGEVRIIGEIIRRLVPRLGCVCINLEDDSLHNREFITRLEVVINFMGLSRLERNYFRVG